MAALVRSMAAPDHPAQPVLVLANRPDAGGLHIANALGVPTAITDHKEFGDDRAGFERAMLRHLTEAAPDIICLAGFMRILSPIFVEQWRGGILNIHPSLLPKYPGLYTHERALAAGDAAHGASVHLVTSNLDAGPILGQISMPILPGDTAYSLALRLLPHEHRLYPEVLYRFALGDQSRLDLP